MAQMTEVPATQTETWIEFLTPRFILGPAPAIMGLWEVNQWMGTYSLPHR